MPRVASASSSRSEGAVSFFKNRGTSTPPGFISSQANGHISVLTNTCSEIVMPVLLLAGRHRSRTNRSAEPAAPSSVLRMSDYRPSRLCEDRLPTSRTAGRIFTSGQMASTGRWPLLMKTTGSARTSAGANGSEFRRDEALQPEVALMTRSGAGRAQGVVVNGLFFLEVMVVFGRRKGMASQDVPVILATRILLGGIVVLTVSTSFKTGLPRPIAHGMVLL
jgi:hypothetical protein